MPYKYPLICRKYTPSTWARPVTTAPMAILGVYFTETPPEVGVCPEANSSKDN